MKYTIKEVDTPDGVQYGVYTRKNVLVCTRKHRIWAEEAITKKINLDLQFWSGNLAFGTSFFIMMSIIYYPIGLPLIVVYLIYMAIRYYLIFKE